MERPGIRAIRTQFATSKSKRELITNSQNTKKKCGQPIQQLFLVIILRSGFGILILALYLYAETLYVRNHLTDASFKVTGP